MSDVAPPLRNARATFDAGALGRGLVIPGLIVVAWTAVTHGGLISGNLLVPIERIVALPFTDEAGRHLWPALFASIVRLVFGFAIGATAGIALGVLMGASRMADRAAGPSFHALRQIALFAWIPLLTAWFGNGDMPKIVYVAMSAFFPAALNSYIGLRNISAQYFEVADVLRLSQLTRIKRLLLPGALPSIFVGLQIALITAWLGTVSSEYAMGNGRGLGGFLLEGRGQFRMDVVVLGVVVLALVGYLINVGCNKLFRRLLVWQGDAK
jgi:sulfonate transport system permease protein